MKLTIPKQVTEEIEVPGEFPLYYEHGYGLIKIISQNEYVAVKEGLEINSLKIHPSIEFGSFTPRVFSAIQNGKATTEKKFIDAFVKTFYQLQQLVNAPVEAGIAQKDAA